MFRHGAIYTVDAARSWAAAWAMDQERETGSIEVGKLALIVLDRDLFALPAGRIHEAKVLRRLYDGRTVYLHDAE